MAPHASPSAAPARPAAASIRYDPNAAHPRKHPRNRRNPRPRPFAGALRAGKNPDTVMRRPPRPITTYCGMVAEMREHLGHVAGRAFFEQLGPVGLDSARARSRACARSPWMFRPSPRCMTNLPLARRQPQDMAGFRQNRRNSTRRASAGRRRGSASGRAPRHQNRPPSLRAMMRSSEIAVAPLERLQRRRRGMRTEFLHRGVEDGEGAVDQLVAPITEASRQRPGCRRG